MLPGTKLGPYEIIEPLGRGGMGEVYRARDTRLQRQVAIKTIASAALTDPQSRERFDREARAVAALTHPNILAIYDVGSHDSVPYVAVELLEGETLRSRIGTSPLPLSAALEYAVQIGRGLAAAHDRGIVHRDLKPENIFVTNDGQIKVLDFGLATEPVSKSGDDSTRLETERGALLGTVGYMSPEQANGKPADARSDIFSFGCVLFEMLSGQRAFKGDSRIETLHAILKEHPPDLATMRSDVPTALDRMVRRCLEKAPAGRFQSARDLVFALETLSGVSGDQAPTASRAAPSRLSVRWTAIAAVAAVVLTGAGVLRWTTVRDRPEQPSERTSAPARDPRRLLAVLPFENISKGGEGYFAAGMTEEVTSRLAKLSGLRVVARAAVAQFKDPRRQLAPMSKELGIGSVVTGTVREDGGRVRVNVELIDAMSGQLIRLNNTIARASTCSRRRARLRSGLAMPSTRASRSRTRHVSASAPPHRLRCTSFTFARSTPRRRPQKTVWRCRSSCSGRQLPWTPVSRWPMPSSPTPTTSRAPTGICPPSPGVSMRRTRRSRSTRSWPPPTARWG